MFPECQVFFLKGFGNSFNMFTRYGFLIRDFFISSFIVSIAKTAYSRDLSRCEMLRNDKKCRGRAYFALVP
jgi:hypothetical protein